jgi:hypothetical protein
MLYLDPVEKVNRVLCEKPVYNGLYMNPKIVTIVDRWSLFRGLLTNVIFKWGLNVVVVTDMWSLAQV